MAAEWLIDTETENRSALAPDEWSGALDLCIKCGHACFHRIWRCCACIGAVEKRCRICEARR